MDIHYTDAEYWGDFLLPLTCTNINGDKYQCNNPLILVPITEEFISMYLSKDQPRLVQCMLRILETHDIDLVNKDFFVKISSISGKDTTFVEDYYDDVTEFWAAMNAQNKKLICKSVEDLCTHILASERIAEYIQHDKYFVFRQWISYGVEDEYRCFIKNKQLVAISQYEYGNALPEHKIQPELVTKMIKNYVDQVATRIPYDDVVLDVAVYDTNVYFIEFNSFGLESDTDAGLYDWANDCDLLNGKHNEVDIRLYDPKWIEAKYAVN